MARKGLFLSLLALCLFGETVASTESIVLALTQPKVGLELLAAKLDRISDIRSPEYGQWLTAGQVEEYVRVSDDRVERAISWLGNQCDGSVAVKSYERRGQGDFVEVDVTLPSRKRLSCLHSIVKNAEKQVGLVDGAFVRGPAGSKAMPQLHELKREPLSQRESTTELGSPNNQKTAYGVPLDAEVTNETNVQLVWGPGTFGYLPSDLETFYSNYDVDASPDTVSTFGYPGTVGGDNFYEGTLDITYISSMGVNAPTIVANTNESSSTEETTGFGYALLAFSEMLAEAGTDQSDLPLPRVVSMSLGSLSYDSCQLLCDELDATTDYSREQCEAYMTTQRQVCMYSSGSIVDRINSEFMKATSRGTTLLGATGDGGSHFSFGAFSTHIGIGRALNDISCAYQLPTFPAESPYVLGVGGEQWSGGGSADAPVYWYAGGVGFSRRFAQPSFQQEAVQNYLANNPQPPASSFNSSMRAYPDLVALASDVPMVANGSTLVTGGTSASTPAFAGMVSLLNDLRLNSGLPPLGYMTPRLYSAASQAADGEMFYDITVGNSSCGGDRYDCGNGFVAASGWDSATGWGSPRWEGLVKYLTTDDN